MSKQFDELSNFILNEMRMSHIYQPVLLIELLSRQGSASTTEIAKALLGHDVSQVEYYEHITKTWLVMSSLKVEASHLKTKTNIH